MENREKYLSFVVPCYNSESYMARCIESLLPGGEDVEIIIIDDGSKDKTGEIADAYQKQYPDLVKVIHKENGWSRFRCQCRDLPAQGVFI